MYVVVIVVRREKENIKGKRRSDKDRKEKKENQKVEGRERREWRKEEEKRKGKPCMITIFIITMISSSLSI